MIISVFTVDGPDPALATTIDRHDDAGAQGS